MDTLYTTCFIFFVLGMTVTNINYLNLPNSMNISQNYYEMLLERRFTLIFIGYAIMSGSVLTGYLCG